MVKTYGDLITRKNTRIPINISEVIRGKKKTITRKGKVISKGISKVLGINSKIRSKRKKGGKK